MKTKRTIKALSLILLLACALLPLVGCKGTDDPTDKENFIADVKADFGCDADGNVEFEAAWYTQEIYLSAAFPLNVKITAEENKIYLNKTVYDSVTLMKARKISYDEETLRLSDERVSDEELSAAFSQLKACKTCYVLKSDDKKSSFAVCETDDAYYFVTLNDSNAAIRIHRAPKIVTDDTSTNDN